MKDTTFLRVLRLIDFETAARLYNDGYRDERLQMLIQREAEVCNTSRVLDELMCAVQVDRIKEQEYHDHYRFLELWLQTA